MKVFLDVVLDSLIDTAKLVPILFIVYFLIEFLEYKNVLRFENSKLLKGNASPVLGAVFGTLPQCGFSVVSAELYSEKKISIGALVAVFIATSDEALPIMLSNYQTIPALIVLLVTKLALAIVIGYLAMFIYSKVFKKVTTVNLSETKDTLKHEHHTHDEDSDHDNEHSEHDTERSNLNAEHLEHSDLAEAETATHSHEHLHACCKHEMGNNKYDWKHPLVHCLKITLYIFLFNIIFGLIIELVGDEALATFLSSSNAFQPLFALLVGLIPNCVSSVVLTELFIMKGLSFGAVITGLSVNAGLGLIVLLKENHNKKDNLFVILSMIIPSLIIGYILHFLPINLF